MKRTPPPLSPRPAQTALQALVRLLARQAARDAVAGELATVEEHAKVTVATSI